MNNNIFHTIKTNTKEINVILNIKYQIDNLQREYRWEHTPIEKLIPDLELKFNKNYDESDYVDKLYVRLHSWLKDVLID